MDCGISLEWLIVGKYANSRSHQLLQKLTKSFGFQPTILGGHTRLSSSKVSKILTDVDFLLPLHYEQVRLGCFTEYFSRTKTSGVEYDSLCHGKYSLLSSWYQPHYDLQSLSISYDCSDSLINFLTSYYTFSLNLSPISDLSLEKINANLEIQFLNTLIRNHI